jgi:hypothetical protein
MQKTYLRATVITVIGMLAVGTIVAGAAERPGTRSVPNITRKPLFEMPARHFSGQVCQINSTNCQRLSQRPPRACLLSPRLCAGRGMRLVPL